jgi:hypothetical protein
MLVKTFSWSGNPLTLLLLCEGSVGLRRRRKFVLVGERNSHSHRMRVCAVKREKQPGSDALKVQECV